MADEFSEEEAEDILDEVHGWGVGFSKSRYFEELTVEQKRESESVIMSFTDYMYSYEGLAPREWNVRGLKECCIYTLTGKVSAKEPYFRSIAPVLSAFFEYTNEKEILKDSSDLARAVRKIDRQIVKRAANPGNWGPAKSVVMAAMGAGVDITDEETMNRFLLAYNLFPAFRGTGGKITHIADDWSEIRIKLPLSWRTRNYVGTIFGGSMYAALDPWYMIILIKQLGSAFVVWDKSASIRFRRPGRTTLYATFQIDAPEIAEIRSALARTDRIDRSYHVELKDGEGTVHAIIEKTIHIRTAEREPQRD